MACCRCLEPPLLARGRAQEGSPLVQSNQQPEMAQYYKNNSCYRVTNGFLAFSLILGISAVSSSCLFYESREQDTVTKVMAIVSIVLAPLAAIPLFIVRRQDFLGTSLRNRFICQLIVTVGLGALGIGLSTASFFYHREACPVVLGVNY